MILLLDSLSSGCNIIQNDIAYTEVGLRTLINCESHNLLSNQT